MKVFQDLIIQGEPEQLRSFYKEIAQVSPNWQVVINLSDEHYLALHIASDNSVPSATLYLHQSESGTGEVTNIIPSDQQELTATQYNRVLQQFYRDCVQPLLSKYNLNVIFSSEEIALSELLSPETERLLHAFSGSANKRSPATHPNDRERWLAFIRASGRDTPIESSFLHRWLVEQGWPEDIASDLVEDYAFGVELLQPLQTAA